MKKKPQNEDSDEFDADEPEEQGSGSDWAPEEDEPQKKKRGRPAAKGNASKKATPAKKKKVEKKPPSDDEDEEEEEEEEEDEEGEESEDESDAAGNGSFVVLRADLKEGSDPPLWKIDGKALLQKFIPFDQDGKKLHKSTSTYSGWTQNNRDQYAVAPVSYVVQGKKETIIEFQRDQVNLDEKIEDKKKPAKA